MIHSPIGQNYQRHSIAVPLSTHRPLLHSKFVNASMARRLVVVGNRRPHGVPLSSTADDGDKENEVPDSRFFDIGAATSEAFTAAAAAETLASSLPPFRVGNKIYNKSTDTSLQAGQMSSQPYSPFAVKNDDEEELAGQMLKRNENGNTQSTPTRASPVPLLKPPRQSNGPKQGDAIKRQWPSVAEQISLAKEEVQNVSQNQGKGKDPGDADKNIPTRVTLNPSPVNLLPPPDSGASTSMQQRRRQLSPEVNAMLRRLQEGASLNTPVAQVPPRRSKSASPSVSKGNEEINSKRDADSDIRKMINERSPRLTEVSAPQPRAHRAEYNETSKARLAEVSVPKPRSQWTSVGENQRLNPDRGQLAAESVPPLRSQRSAVDEIHQSNTDRIRSAQVSAPQKRSQRSVADEITKPMNESSRSNEVSDPEPRSLQLAFDNTRKLNNESDDDLERAIQRGRARVEEALRSQGRIPQDITTRRQLQRRQDTAVEVAAVLQSLEQNSQIVTPESQVIGNPAPTKPKGVLRSKGRVPEVARYENEVSSDEELDNVMGQRSWSKPSTGQQPKQLTRQPRQRGGYSDTNEFDVDDDDDYADDEDEIDDEDESFDKSKQRRRRKRGRGETARRRSSLHDESLSQSSSPEEEGNRMRRGEKESLSDIANLLRQMQLRGQYANHVQGAAATNEAQRTSDIRTEQEIPKESGEYIVKPLPISGENLYNSADVVVVPPLKSSGSAPLKGFKSWITKPFRKKHTKKLQSESWESMLHQFNKNSAVKQLASKAIAAKSKPMISWSTKNLSSPTNTVASDEHSLNEDVGGIPSPGCNFSCAVDMPWLEFLVKTASAAFVGIFAGDDEQDNEPPRKR